MPTCTIAKKKKLSVSGFVDHHFFLCITFFKYVQCTKRSYLYVCVPAGCRVRRGASEKEPVMCRPPGQLAWVSSSASGRGALRRQTEAADPTGDGAALLRPLPRYDALTYTGLTSTTLDIQYMKCYYRCNCMKHTVNYYCVIRSNRAKLHDCMNYLLPSSFWILYANNNLAWVICFIINSLVFERKLICWNLPMRCSLSQLVDIFSC